MNKLAFGVSLAACMSVLAASPIAAERLVIGAAISKTGWNAAYDSPVMDGLPSPSTR